MALQSSVNVLQGFGVVGSFFDASPRRVNVMNVSATDADATVGRAFTYDDADPDSAVQAGTGVFAGILVNAKTQTHSGLDATLVVPDNSVADLATMGHIVVKPANDVAIGNSAYYDDTTGEIYAYDGVAAIADRVLITGSQFVKVTSVASTGLAVLSITNA